MAHLRAPHLFALLALIAGCPDSHGTEGDAGTPDAPYYDSWCLACEDASLPPPDVSPHDVGPDAPEPASCAPDDAREVVCPDAICDGLDQYAWDGERCVTIACGTCEGTDCGTLTTSLEACQLAHATCDAELCRTTGGDWQFWAEECGHYVCGQPVDATCFVGMPVCNCGYERSFETGRGCVPDECPIYDLAEPSVLCGETGGTWTAGICCSTRCGVPCDLDCVAPACVCGAMEIFDAIRGCIPATECFERELGQTCTNVNSRCADGLLCCQRCTGAGCDPDSVCQAPVCDGDPTIDECGNNLLAP